MWTSASRAWASLRGRTADAVTNYGGMAAAIATPLALASVFAAPLNPSFVPLSARKRGILISVGTEKLVGELVELTLRSSPVLPHDDERNVTVQIIANELLSAAVRLAPALADWNWRIIVVDEPLENAFAAPGGLIVVYRGMLDSIAERASSPEVCQDRVARLLSHEIAHVIARHNAEKVSHLPVVALLGLLLFMASPLVSVPIVGAYAMMELPACRQRETEADVLGIALLTAAGYNPYTVSEFFRDRGFAPTIGDLLPFTFEESLERASPSVAAFLHRPLPHCLQTHPVDVVRAERVDARLHEWFPQGSVAGLASVPQPALM